MRDRFATRALVLGLLALPFGVLAPFAIWSGVRSLRRIRASDSRLDGAFRAGLGLTAGIVGAAFLVAGAAYWFLTS